MGHQISYWLMPSAKDRDYLKAIIMQLARDYDTPVFEPHMTLFSTEEKNLDKPKEIINNLSNSFSYCSLRTEKLDYSDSYTKTLYLNLEKTNELDLLFKRIKKLSKPKQDYNLSPHISLLYLNTKLSKKKSIASKLKIETELVQFSEIAAVLMDQKNEVKDDILKWQIIDRKELSD